MWNSSSEKAPLSAGRLWPGWGFRMRTGIAAAMCVLCVAACGTRVTGSSASASRRATASQSLGVDAAGDAPDASDAAAGQDGQATTGPGAAGGGGVSGAGTASGTGTATRGGSTAAGKGAPVVLGAVGDRSGVLGAALAEVWSGLDTWVAAVNANGGVAGHPVKMVTADDAGDPGKYAAAVRQLITEDHVVAFVGNQAPLTFSAGTSTLEQYGVPALGGDSSDPGWFNSPMAFPINSVNIPLGRTVGVWGGAHLKQSKAAVYYVNEAQATTQVAQAFITPWKAAGKQVVAQQGVSLATPDFTSEILQAQSAGADVVMLVLDAASCQRFWDAARRQHYKPLFFASGCDLTSLKNNSDMTANNTYLGDSHRTILPGLPAADEFIKAANRFNPGHDLNHAALTWLSGKLFEAAVAAAGGGMTSADVVRGLHSLKNETLGGLSPAQDWPDGNHPPGQCGVVEQFNGQGIVEVTPDFVC
jgi:branched-chain amino acid transport system substrate-binding protein